MERRISRRAGFARRLTTAIVAGAAWIVPPAVGRVEPAAAAAVEPASRPLRAPSRIQDAPSDPTASFDGAVAALDAAFEGKDSVAIESAMKDLEATLATVGEAQKKEAAKKIARGFDPSMRAEEIGIAAARSLGRIGGPGGELLMRAAKDSSLSRQRPETRREAVRALGRIADERHAKELVKLLQDKDNRIVAAAAGAIGGFDHAKDALRKDLVQEIVDLALSVSNQARDPKNRPMQDKRDTILPDCTTAFANLTGQTNLKTPEEWQKWFNENKKAKWPSP